MRTTAQGFGSINVPRQKYGLTEREVAAIRENEAIIFLYEKIEPVRAILEKYGAVPTDSVSGSLSDQLAASAAFGNARRPVAERISNDFCGGGNMTSAEAAAPNLALQDGILVVLVDDLNARGTIPLITADFFCDKMSSTVTCRTSV